MKRSIHFALALLFFIGCVHTAYPSQDFDFDAPGSPASAEVCNPIYNANDCPGIQQYFAGQPIPLGTNDAANGKTIVGYDVICEGAVVASQGGAGTEVRDIPRVFGFIRVRYRSAPPAP